jgi:hypothetical protein
MRSRRFLPLLLLRARRVLPAAALLIASCIGGTGTDTENGVTGLEGFKTGTATRVVDAGGRPLAGVEIVLREPGFRPDSGAPGDLVVDPGKPMVSNDSGYVTFHLLAPGKYVVEARRDGASLLFDTLAVSDVHAPTLVTYRARATSPLQGRVRLGSGLKVDSGTVFIRGTSRRASLGADGGYDLGLLPGDVDRMAIGLAYRASLREARIAEQSRISKTADTGLIGPRNPDTAAPVFTCRVATADSAARFTDARTPPASSGFPSASADSLKLDTARLAAVGRSCDSLPSGTLVAIGTVRTDEATPTGVKATDGAVVEYIAVDGSPAVPLQGDTATVLVPLKGCVAAPGTAVTTYSLSFRPTPSGTDLYVGDVDAGCLE